MRRTTAILMTTLTTTGLVAMTSALRAQSAMPNFSNPYGGVSSYVQGQPAPAPIKKTAAKKPSTKIAHRSVPAQTTTTQKPTDLDADGGFSPADTSSHPVVLGTQPKQKDSALNFGMKWSASSDPIYNPGTSTVPGVDQVKRSLGEPGVETGSGVEAGVNLKF